MRAPSFTAYCHNIGAHSLILQVDAIFSEKGFVPTDVGLVEVIEPAPIDFVENSFIGSASLAVPGALLSNGASAQQQCLRCVAFCASVYFTACVMCIVCWSVACCFV